MIVKWTPDNRGTSDFGFQEHFLVQIKEDFTAYFALLRRMGVTITINVNKDRDVSTIPVRN